MSISKSRTTTGQLSLVDVLVISLAANYAAVISSLLSAAWLYKIPMAALAAIPVFIFLGAFLMAVPGLTRKSNLARGRKRDRAVLLKTLFINEPHSSISYSRMFCISLDKVLLSIAITFLLLTALFMSTLSLALAADAIQAHEPAERIFSLLPLPCKRTISLASFRASCLNNTEENHLVDGRLNTAVANVYGGDSRQMAFLLFMEGEHCRAEGSGLFYREGRRGLSDAEMMKQIVEAKQWYQKSLSIHERLGLYAGCVNDLGGIVRCQLREGEIDESRRSLDRALEIIRSHSEIRPSEDTFQALAWAHAGCYGQEKLSEPLSRLSRLRARGDGNGPDHEATAWFLFALRSIALWPLIYLAANTFAFSITAIQLRRLSNKWLRQVAGCNDFQVKVDALSNLTTLELYKQKLGRADAYSLQLLKLCETHNF